MRRLVRSDSAADAEEALNRAEVVAQAMLLVASGSGPPVVTAAGRDILYGSGGVAAHYSLLCRRALGMPASETLLTAMFDGESPRFEKSRLTRGHISTALLLSA